jgi:hypothetical protein
MFENYIFYFLYQFVTYLLTLPLIFILKGSEDDIDYCVWDY